MWEAPRCLLREGEGEEGVPFKRPAPKIQSGCPSSLGPPLPLVVVGLSTPQGWKSVAKALPAELTPDLASPAT